MAIPWHRIFGMALTQYFSGTAWRVDVEVDLSLQQQRLDLVILRRQGDSAPPIWPDGFGTPAEYNLLTFKALKDPLDAWAVKELSAHGVNYRKQISPHPDRLLPEGHFRLLAASMHFPRQLASQAALQPQGPGAYDVVWGTDTTRILVLRDAGGGAERRLEPLQWRRAAAQLEQLIERVIGVLRFGGHSHAVHDGRLRARGGRKTAEEADA